MPQSTSCQTAFEAALAHHQSERLQEAEQGYLNILEQEPGHAGALHLLGMVRYQTGEIDRGLELLSQAIEIAPDYAQAHSDLGSLLRDQGRLDEAVDRYRQALEIAPRYAAAHNNLGTVLKDQGELDEAIACFRHALEIAPNYAVAHNNLGIVLKDQGKLDDAIASFQHALAIAPNYAAAHNNLGTVLKKKGKLDEAVASYRRALEIAPGYAKAHSNLGSALKGQGKIDEAVACFRHALEVDPKYDQARTSLGYALQRQGDLDGAIACFESLVATQPTHAPLHFALSAALKSRGSEQEARSHFIEGIRRKPIVTVACTGGEKPLATVLKLSSHERSFIWLKNGKQFMSTGPTNEPLLLNPDKFTVHKYFILEENLLNSANDLPCFDVVVNGVVNPDSERESLATACRFIAQHDVPCINDPRKIDATTRENVSQLLASVDNLVVPRIVREELPRRETSLFMPIMEKHALRFPLIVRPVGGHMGSGMVKVEREEDFAKVIFFDETLEFYLIEYHDYRSDDWYFRKMRFFFISGKAYPYHLAISNNWLIHHHTSLMSEHEWMRKEEESFFEDHVDYLYCCNDISEILTDINSAIGLDYFGVDCALLKSGEILIFECNPAMVVRLDDPKDKYAYKYVHVPKIVAAYEDMVLGKIRQ